MTEKAKGLRWIEAAIVAAALVFIPWTIEKGKSTESLFGNTNYSVESIGSFYSFFLRYDPTAAFPIGLNANPIESDATIGPEYGCFVSQNTVVSEMTPSDGECVSQFFFARYILQLILAALIVGLLELFVVSDPQIPAKDKIAKIRAHISKRLTGVFGE